MLCVLRCDYTEPINVLDAFLAHRVWKTMERRRRNDGRCEDSEV